MKPCLILFLAVFGIFADDLTIFDAHEYRKEPVASIIQECIQESQVKPELIDEFYATKSISTLVTFKCYMRCFGTKLGVLNDKADLDVQRWVELFNLSLPIAQKCANIVEPDICEKAYLLLKCAKEEVAKDISQ